jgi:hypothetical protein
MTHDGGIVVGARQSTVFMVDAASGKLLKKFDASTGTFEAVEGDDTQDRNGSKVGEVDECIYMGEQEELEQPDHADRAAEAAAEGPSGECPHVLFDKVLGNISRESGMQSYRSPMPMVDMMTSESRA